MKTIIIGNSKTTPETFTDRLKKLLGCEPDYFILNIVKNNLNNKDLILISADDFDREVYLSISEQLPNMPKETVTMLYGTDISKAGLMDICPVDSFLLLNNKRSRTESENDDQLKVRIFGKFEIFKNKKPIQFKNRKSKELLALCIDRRGSRISSIDAADYLWSDRMSGENVSQLYRKAARDLANTLSAEGMDNIFMREYGECWVDMSRIKCDMFCFITDPKRYILINGDYMSDYEWADSTREKIRSLLYSSEDELRYYI